MSWSVEGEAKWQLGGNRVIALSAAQSIESGSNIDTRVAPPLRRHDRLFDAALKFKCQPTENLSAAIKGGFELARSNDPDAGYRAWSVSATGTLKF